MAVSKSWFHNQIADFVFLQTLICNICSQLSAGTKVPDYNNNNDDTKRSNSRFFTISSLRHELSPICMLKWPGRNHEQILCNTSGACRGFPTRMVYLYCISCLRYTIPVGDPRYHVQHVLNHMVWRQLNH